MEQIYETLIQALSFIGRLPVREITWINPWLPMSAEIRFFYIPRDFTNSVSNFIEISDLIKKCLAFIF